MFCSSCGMKLEPEWKRCKNCGEPVGSAEYCGGFWGLVGEEAQQKMRQPAPKAREEIQREERRITENSVSKDVQQVAYHATEHISSDVPDEGKRIDRARRAETPKKKKKKRLPVMAILCVVFLLLFSVQSLRVSGFQKKVKAQANELKSITEQQTELTEKYQLIETQRQELEAQKEELESENNELSSQVSTLSQENEKLSAQVQDMKTQASQTAQQAPSYAYDTGEDNAESTTAYQQQSENYSEQ